MTVICYGIDLGTTHTVVIRSEYSNGEWKNECLQLPGCQELKENDTAAYLLPSVVHYKKDGTVVVGQAAREAVKYDPEHVYFNSKIGLGGNTDREHKAVDCAAEILKVCFAAIYVRDGENVRICISVPAAFSQDKKKEVEEAALKAGKDFGFFKDGNVRTTEEPYAAFLNIIQCEKEYYSNILHPDNPTYAMLIDIGGGTLDIITCGFTFDSDGLHVNFRGKSPGDADEFAGACFDQKLMEKFMQDFLTHYHLQPEKISDEVLRKLENQFQIYGEDTKKILCAREKAYEFTPDIEGIELPPDIEPFKLSMNKQEMDAVLKPLIVNKDGLESIDSCIVKHLQHNMMSFRDIDFVYLTGGMSKYDKIYEHIKDMTQRPVYRAKSPLLCTALGIATAVHVEIRDDKCVDYFPLVEASRAAADDASSADPEQTAAPQTEGADAGTVREIPIYIDAPNQIGAAFFIDVDGGLPVEIIPKTHKFPCPLEFCDVKLCTTSQSRIDLIIFEGDNRYDPDLKLLKLKTIHFENAIETGTPVKLSFKIDANKIITFFGSINGAKPIQFDCYTGN
ncbi:MAG: Hsp70 family protein [Oscillospiraceae bacterium]|nr:Hsp70 family protein [Oscillospiraceae bacterium]